MRKSARVHTHTHYIFITRDRRNKHISEGPSPIAQSPLCVNYNSSDAKLTTQLVVRQAESLASSEPLNATQVVLDTVPAEEQLKPALTQKVYVAQGNPIPKVGGTPRPPFHS